MDGIIYGDAKLSEHYTDNDFDFRFAYDWLIGEMEKRISSRPFVDAVPVWAWYHYQNSEKKRPDLRCSGHLQKGQKGVRVEFIKPENQMKIVFYKVNYFPIQKIQIYDKSPLQSLSVRNM